VLGSGKITQPIMVLINLLQPENLFCLRSALQNGEGKHHRFSRNPLWYVHNIIYLFFKVIFPVNILLI
jgi:hypothetical protein